MNVILLNFTPVRQAYFTRLLNMSLHQQFFEGKHVFFVFFQRLEFLCLVSDLSNYRSL